MIFDCDGVLVDSEPIVIAVLAERMRQLGARITDEECAFEFTGLASDAAVDRIIRRVGSVVPPGWFDDLTVAVDAALRTQVQPVPGVAAVLGQLDVPFCVASNGRPEKVTLTLGTSGLLEYFEGRVFTSSQVASGKPAPDLFLLAAARMGVDPGRCVVVEDSEPGVIAARAAGMRVFQYAPGHSRRSENADLVFARMAELPALFGLSVP